MADQISDNFFGAATAQQKLRQRAMDMMKHVPSGRAKAMIASQVEAIERGEVQNEQFSADLQRDQIRDEVMREAHEMKLDINQNPGDFAALAIDRILKHNYPGAAQDAALVLQWKQMQEARLQAMRLQEAKINETAQGRGDFFQVIETPEGVVQVDTRRPGVAFEAGTGRRVTGPVRSAKLDPTRRSALSFADEAGKEGGKHLFKQRELALDAVTSLNAITEARQLLDAGMNTGRFANFETGLGAVLNEMGLSFDEDPVANTQAFVAAQAKQVAAIIKAFGAGTGLSDADREFAIKAAGGEVKFTEKAIQKILNINDRAAREVLSRYKDLTKRIRGQAVPFDLSVDEPATETPSPKAPQKPNLRDGWSVRVK